MKTIEKQQNNPIVLIMIIDAINITRNESYLK